MLDSRHAYLNFVFAQLPAINLNFVFAQVQSELGSEVQLYKTVSLPLNKRYPFPNEVESNLDIFLIGTIVVVQWKLLTLIFGMMEFLGSPNRLFLQQMKNLFKSERRQLSATNISGKLRLPANKLLKILVLLVSCAGLNPTY